MGAFAKAWLLIVLVMRTDCISALEARNDALSARSAIRVSQLRDLEPDPSRIVQALAAAILGAAVGVVAGCMTMAMSSADPTTQDGFGYLVSGAAGAGWMAYNIKPGTAVTTRNERLKLAHEGVKDGAVAGLVSGVLLSLVSGSSDNPDSSPSSASSLVGNDALESGDTAREVAPNRPKLLQMMSTVAALHNMFAAAVGGAVTGYLQPEILYFIGDNEKLKDTINEKIAEDKEHHKDRHDMIRSRMKNIMDKGNQWKVGQDLIGKARSIKNMKNKGQIASMVAGGIMSKVENAAEEHAHSVNKVAAGLDGFDPADVERRTLDRERSQEILSETPDQALQLVRDNVDLVVEFAQPSLVAKMIQKQLATDLFAKDPLFAGTSSDNIMRLAGLIEKMDETDVKVLIRTVAELSNKEIVGLMGVVAPLSQTDVSPQEFSTLISKAAAAISDMESSTLESAAKSFIQTLGTIPKDTLGDLVTDILNNGSLGDVDMTSEEKSTVLRLLGQ